MTDVASQPEVIHIPVVEEQAEGLPPGFGAGTLLAGDLGCLMNMAGKLKREGSAVETRHVAEVLAGMTDGPPIGGRG
jgi:L-lactate dehydrogenase complex protein LldE